MYEAVAFIIFQSFAAETFECHTALLKRVTKSFMVFGILEGVVKRTKSPGSRSELGSTGLWP